MRGSVLGVSESDPKWPALPDRSDRRPWRAVITPDGVTRFEHSSSRADYPPGTRVFEMRTEPLIPWRERVDEQGVRRRVPDPQLEALAEELGGLLAELVHDGKIDPPAG